MTSPTAYYGKFPKGIADSGILASLRRSELSTLLVLVAHTNGRTLESYPAVETIMRLTGLCDRSVQRATKGLCEKKVIATNPGGGRGHTTTYRLLENPVIEDDTVPELKPRHPGVTVSRLKPRHLDVTVSPVKGDISDPKPRHPDVTRTEEQQDRYAGASGKTKSSKGESPHQSLIAHFTGRWSEIVGGGAAYPFAGARDAKAVKTILDAVTGDLERAKRVVDLYLIDDDPWLVENGRGRGLALLASRARLTKYLAGTANRRPEGRMDEDSAEHPLIADARAKWSDDVTGHLDEWRALAVAVEAGRIQVNAVVTSDTKSGEDFRAEHNQELARAAN